jgi:hypothetical protein
MSTTAQHTPTLGHANRARGARCEVRRALASAELSLAGALGDPRASRMRVWDLLHAQYGWGEDRCWKALVEAGRILWPDAVDPPPLGAALLAGELRERERNALIQACKGRVR